MDRLPIDEIVFRDDLYPRIEKSPITVQKYAEDLSVLPPIEVNQNKELIDGWHRWTAHKKVGAKDIETIIIETKGDTELLELAIERNAQHGLQLSQDDKKKMARRLYESTAYASQKEREQRKAYLADILSVSERIVRQWLERMDKDAKAELRQRAFNMWLACHTQQEIADEIGYSKPAVNAFLDSLFTNGDVTVSEQTDDSDDDTNSLGRYKLERSQIAAAEHATDFEPPIYNVWKQQNRSAGVDHFGTTEIRWLDNLLYLYTKPFDVVVDPFAGSGSTIDLCRKRLRRYWVSDRLIEPENEGRIRQLDITEELPKMPRWQDVQLVYLDPPYWRQALGQYGEDPTNLANMELDQFHDALAALVKKIARKMADGYIALVISPTQWHAPERQFTDHLIEINKRLKLPIEMRYSAPYESQQVNAQMVEWFKENRRCAVLTREFVVWRVC